MGCRMVLCYERDRVRLFSGRFLRPGGRLGQDTAPAVVDEAEILRYPGLFFLMARRIKVQLPRGRGAP